MSDSGPMCFVVSAPSGAGKTSLAAELLRRVGGIQRTVSWTTRPPRSHEADGVDYVFVDAATFAHSIADGGFLEWAEVHGHRYGTPCAEVDRIRAAGDDALMVIDVQGAASVREALPRCTTVFILPPSRRALIERLQGRDGLGGGEGRSLRLRTAEHEIAEYVKYDYVIINDEFDVAAGELAAIVRAARCRRPRRRAEAERLLARFRAEAAG